MTTTTLRKRLVDFLQTADEKKVKAIYTLFQEEIEAGYPEYDTELKKELDRRIEYYKTGGVTISAAEMKKRLRAVRGKVSK
ncbi:MAG: hypothetical protein JNL23_06135 [Chitinophagaceae bacterium]|nr:hypothetical protein [Chitinophagaceae bacterium]